MQCRTRREDLKPEIEATCKPQCIKQLMAYQACTKRIEAKHNGHCTGQYFDYWSCVDKCAAPKIFSVLKWTCTGKVFVLGSRASRKLLRSVVY